MASALKSAAKKAKPAKKKPAARRTTRTAKKSAGARGSKPVKRPRIGSRILKADALSAEELIAQLLATWQRHNEILLFLLDRLPQGGLRAVPAGSRGRTVAAQFVHIQRVRRGWLQMHRTGLRPRMPKTDAANPPTRMELRRALRASADDVAAYLERALKGEARMRMFGGSPVRWLGYLISHESHHRGSIMLALKQNDLRVPESVAIQGLWGRWFMGK